MLIETLKLAITHLTQNYGPFYRVTLEDNWLIKKFNIYESFILNIVEQSTAMSCNIIHGKLDLGIRSIGTSNVTYFFERLKRILIFWKFVN